MANAQKNLTRRLVLSALLAALTCVMTMVVKIPSPLQGYLNLGDGAVLLCGWVLDPVYGFLAAGIGSALADMLSGYMVYIPATFAIKGLMALIAYWGLRLPWKNGAKLLAGIVAEIVMVLGYFVFEGFLYGFAESVVNIPANAVQGVAGLLIGLALSKIFKRTNLFT